MSQLQIQLPDDAQKLAEEQIATGRYQSISEYIAALIRQDHKAIGEEAHEKLLVARLRSGPPREMTDSDFDAIRGRLENEIDRRRNA